MVYFLVHISNIPYLGWLFACPCFPLKFQLQRFFNFKCEESDSEFSCVCSLRRLWSVASFFKFMSEYGQPNALVCNKMRAQSSVYSDKSVTRCHWTRRTSSILKPSRHSSLTEHTHISFFAYCPLRKGLGSRHWSAVMTIHGFYNFGNLKT